MTGMSSLIGYTRWHVAHFSADPFLTSVTGVLQFGQARIARSSGSTAMAELYDTFRLLWNNSPMKVASLIAGVSLFAASLASAQTPADPAARTGDAYSQYMLGRHLESADDIPGAIAAFKRASQLDPQSGDIVAELAGLYMRQSRLEEAMTAGEQALKVEPANREAHRVLGIVYATLVESGRRTQPRTGQNATSMAENLTKAIEHLE